MADNYAICLVGAMDDLWFHQIILFSEPTKLLVPKTLETPQPSLESLTCQSSMNSIPEDEISSVASSTASSTPQDDSDIEKETKLQRQRPTRLNVIAAKSRSHSSSPSTHSRLRHLRLSGSETMLQKTTSCKSLWELEVEEVKGFMDLGFEFRMENLSPRMMSVLPGLQRLGDHKNEQNGIVEKDDEIEEDGEKRGVRRPYLSEAWLIKRPDSPLINLRLPRASAANDMKKHIRYWARTVASVIHQES